MRQKFHTHFSEKYQCLVKSSMESDIKVIKDFTTFQFLRNKEIPYVIQ